MANIFEQLMKSNQDITESVILKSMTKSSPIKIKSSNIRVESKKVLEDASEDELAVYDDEFAVTPEDAESNEDEVVLVIDPDVNAADELPEDAAEQMIGDMVYKCPVCGSNYVCDCSTETNESVVVNDEGVPVECPICGDDHDQILIGEIAPAEDAGEEEKAIEPAAPETDAEEEVKEESEEEEVVEEGLNSTCPACRQDPCVCKAHRRHSKKVDECDTTSMDEGCSGKNSKKKKVKEDFEDIGEVEETEVVEVPEDPDAFDLDLIIPETSCDECDEDKGEEEEDEEKKKESPAVEVNTDVVNLVIDDKRFESMMTKIIRENYHGSPSFKVTKCTLKGSSKLVVEYVVSEGKKSSKGRLVGEGFNPKSRAFKVKFTDAGVFTESRTRYAAFVVECVRLRNVIIPTKVNYDYKVKVNEQLYRVKGSMSSK